MSLNDILYRDDALAKREAEAGMHHTMFWACIIRGLLTRCDLAISNRSTGMDTMNGAHYFQFDDPITGKTYDVRIKPRTEKKK
jgi:hypothetical protein